MLSRELLRSQPDLVAAALANRRTGGEQLAAWRELDTARRSHLVQVEELKARRNTASREIGRLKSSGGDAAALLAEMAGIKSEIERLETAAAGLDGELEDLEARLPNLPDPSVPIGPDESANRVERVVGAPPTFTFEPLPHWELGTRLGILDFERAAKITGARFTVLWGLGARLERALIQLMLDLHTEKHGYTEVLPPFIVNGGSLFGTGQLPKFAADLFRLDGLDYYLIPTAEVPVTNLHRDEVLDENTLPRRYTAYTPCFRSEAGSHGRDVRGLIRQHQFDKVELVQLTTPEQSLAALEELTGHAARVLERLELPYRVVCLSTGDMGFSAAKTYDLEVWLPSQGTYREISSCSTCSDFQARRGNLRYRPADGGKPRLVHTLNGSGLAVGRTLIAILENYQQADGSVLVPAALRPYLGGRERLAAG